MNLKKNKNVHDTRKIISKNTHIEKSIYIYYIIMRVGKKYNI